MNLSSLVGLSTAVATVWFTVIAESPNPAMLLEWKGLMLVVGGTAAAGQHKGLMLRLLLKRTGADKKIKAIVAVDDKLKLCKQYEEAFAPKMDAHCVRYGATDKRVASFFESDKKAVVEGWSDIEKTAKKYYPFDWE